VSRPSNPFQRRERACEVHRVLQLPTLGAAGQGVRRVRGLPNLHAPTSLSDATFGEPPDLFGQYLCVECEWPVLTMLRGGAGTPIDATDPDDIRLTYPGTDAVHFSSKPEIGNGHSDSPTGGT
jgi:hypothetical protein